MSKFIKVHSCNPTIDKQTENDILVPVLLRIDSIRWAYPVAGYEPNSGVNSVIIFNENEQELFVEETFEELEAMLMGEQNNKGNLLDKVFDVSELHQELYRVRHIGRASVRDLLDSLKTNKTLRQKMIAFCQLQDTV